jgi:hypothetical protein
MRYLRLYADSDGETHCEDVEDEMRVEDFVPPAEPFFVSEIRDATRFSFFRIFRWLGWHRASCAPAAIFCRGSGRDRDYRE